MLISLTLAPLVKTQLKSEFLPILLRVNAYQFCIPFCFSTEQNRTNRVDWVRLGSVIELNRTHKKVPVRLCSIAEPIELQSNDWVRLGSIGFWFGFVRLTTPGVKHGKNCTDEWFYLHGPVFAPYDSNALYILEQSSDDILKTLIASFMNNFHVRNACCSYKAFE